MRLGNKWFAEGCRERFSPIYPLLTSEKIFEIVFENDIGFQLEFTYPELSLETHNFD
jgi:hypothetical protein